MAVKNVRLHPLARRLMKTISLFRHKPDEDAIARALGTERQLEMMRDLTDAPDDAAAKKGKTP